MVVNRSCLSGNTNKYNLVCLELASQSSVFRRTKYPAVAWHQPMLSKRDKNTVVSVTVCNHGPTELLMFGWVLPYLVNSRLKHGVRLTQ